MRASALVLAPLVLLAGCSREPPSVWIVQRSQAPAPGLEGKVEIRLGDIVTAEGVRIDVLTADGTPIATAEQAQEGTRIPFEFEGRRYELVVVSFDLHVVGDDSAKIALETVD